MPSHYDVVAHTVPAHYEYRVVSKNGVQVTERVCVGTSTAYKTVFVPGQYINVQAYDKGSEE